MVWFDTAWYGMIWYGTTHHGTPWYDLVWHDTLWYSVIWYGTAWNDMVSFGTVWYPMGWHGMVWDDMVWFGLIWHTGMVLYGMAQMVMGKVFWCTACKPLIALLSSAFVCLFSRALLCSTQFCFKFYMCSPRP